MSSPDSDIISRLLTDSDKAKYLKILEDYIQTKHIVSAFNERLQALKKEQEEILDRITKENMSLENYFQAISDLLKRNLSESSNNETKEKVYTDIHKVDHFGRNLDIAHIYLHDPDFKDKQWKSKGFLKHLCYKYPVFLDLGDATIKKVGLEEALIYWEKEVEKFKCPLPIKRV